MDYFENKTKFTGYIADDIVLKDGKGCRYCRLDIAVERPDTTKTIVDYVPVQLWNDVAAAFAGQFKKGDFVTVFGAFRKNQGHIVIECKKFAPLVVPIENQNVHSNGQNT